MNGISQLVGICTAGSIFLIITLGSIRQRKQEARSIERRLQEYAEGKAHPATNRRFNRVILRRLWQYTQQV